jgi:nicotinate-nucleotide--dimethylbenzimidazole phosphoribosyltransferase
MSMHTTQHPVSTSEYWSIPQLDHSQLPSIQHHIDIKTKPIGALGQLEKIAKKLNLTRGYYSGNYTHLEINRPAIMIFAVDHVIAQTT